MGSPQAAFSLPGSSWPNLPLFPHPASLFAGAGNPFVVGEASSATAALDKLKDDLKSGVFDLALPPPTADQPSLAPLPPIPVPPVSTAQGRSSIATANSSGKPLLKPPIPKSQQRKDLSITEALQEWSSQLASQPTNAPGDATTSTTASAPHGPQAPIERITASLNSRGDAILFELGSERSHGAAWALLRLMKDFDGTLEDGSNASSVRISGIKLFAPFDCTRGPPLLHKESTNAAYRDFGKHLSALNLSLPELLFRLPHVPGLLKSPCFHCGKLLVSPDGLPAQGSGFLPYSGKRKRKVGRDAEKKDASGVKEEAETEGKKGEPEDNGRWVCWHASCEP